MEEEAMLQEQSSLESQLASLKTQITTLTSEVDEQQAKVILVSLLFVRFAKNEEIYHVKILFLCRLMPYRRLMMSLMLSSR